MARRKPKASTSTVDAVEVITDLEPAANPLPVFMNKERTATRVRLTQPHRHAGTAHPANTVLEVREGTARWLVDQGVAEPTEATHDAE